MQAIIDLSKYYQRIRSLSLMKGFVSSSIHKRVVKVSIEDDNLFFFTRSEVISIEVQVPAKTSGNCSFPINLDDLLPVLAVRKDSSKVRFDLDNEKLIIRSDRSRNSINVVDVNISERLNNEYFAMIETEKLSTLLNGVVEITMGGSSMLYSGVSMVLSSNILRFEAMNGISCFSASAAIEVIGELQEFNIVVSKFLISAVLSIIKTSGIIGKVAIGKSRSSTAITFDGIEVICSNLAYDNYPDLASHMFKGENESRIYVKSKSLSHALDVVLLNATDDSTSATFNISAGEIRVTSLNEESEETIQCSNPDMLNVFARFNGARLLDLIKLINEENLIMSFKVVKNNVGSGQSATIWGELSEERKTLIVGLRTDG